MQILLFIPAVIVFLYALYRLVKDDYIFIRKGISLEQTFDFAFIALWVGLIMSRALYLLIHLHKGENFFVDFISFKNGGLSLTGAILGGTLAVYLLSRYKRFPLGRLGDFLSLSLLYALPLVFLLNAVFAKKDQILLVFLNAIVYFVLLLFFMQFLYPKVMNRSLRDGMMSILFLLLYSSIALITSLLISLKNIQAFINPENFLLLILFIVSIFLLIKQDRTSPRPRTIIRQ
ncbi:MAG TPA: prolipoprotein diacylglyceryl transferase family protein [Candidatus Saccharimonadales bacterium]|nr:prolipoprotein diacylglyceryl transferase family protein [Candidatus Saccharimonadales bacterium]